MREYDHEQPFVDTTEEVISRLSLTFPYILADHAMRIEKHPDRISEVEPALCEALIAFGAIPLEYHAGGWFNELPSSRYLLAVSRE